MIFNKVAFITLTLKLIKKIIKLLDSTRKKNKNIILITKKISELTHFFVLKQI